MIIGRNKEQRELHEAYESEYSEFSVVYGRRRVGKTFLVRETFDYTFTFEHSINEHTHSMPYYMTCDESLCTGDNYQYVYDSIGLYQYKQNQKKTSWKDSFKI